MTTTLQDIATRAGVSRSTVSRALKGNGRMSEDTRRMIQEIAEEMGYVPNFLAQSLTEQATRMIGVVITSVADPFVWELIEGIEQVADTADYTIVLGASKFDPNKELETIMKFYQRRVEGIIVLTAHLTDFSDARFGNINVPIVLINDETDYDVKNNITIDSRREVRKAINYLFGIGHTRIGYVGSPIRILSNRLRLKGYQDAYAENGHVLNPSHIFSTPVMSDYETGYKALDRIQDTDVTAVFCYNDAIAIGLMNACRERGVHVPEELSVVGFDNVDQASHFYPTLTTIHQPKFELGRTAMQVIWKPDEAIERVLECKLIVRDSTRPLYR